MTAATSLAPVSVTARAEPFTRLGIAFGPRFFVLLGIGLLWLGPALVAPEWVYAMVAWDSLVVLAWLADLRRIPGAGYLAVQRTWGAPSALSIPSAVQVTLFNESSSVISARVMDLVPHQLRGEPPSVSLIVPAHGEAVGEYTVAPTERGPASLGDAYIRYRSPMRIAERWGRARIPQTVVTYPNLNEAKRESMYLVRSRQIETERRSRRIRGAGRSFESLREHRAGDEFRDICWTASARRGKLVTRLYEVERSQPIWLVLDSGRLMRARVDGLSKLDLAANAALTLAQCALLSGDRVGLLAYSHRIGHRLPSARGRAHLRQIIEHLAHVRTDDSESDHRHAAGALLADQKRRSLIVWMTDIPDTAMTPDVVTAASQLMARHLVLFVVISQPDLQRVATRKPESAEEMYETAAAQEVQHRRDLLLSRLRGQGAFTIEASSSLSPAIVNAYFEIKQRNRL